MSASIPPAAIDALIRLGAASSTGKVVEELLYGLKPYDVVNRKVWDDWDAITAKLEESEHRQLAGGLVIAEERLRWSGGSVAAAIWVFLAFRRKFPAASNFLAEWMMQHSDNPDVPFSTNRGSTRSLAELHAALGVNGLNHSKHLSTRRNFDQIAL